MLICEYRMRTQTGEISVSEIEVNDGLGVNLPMVYRGEGYYGAFLKDHDGLTARGLFLDMLKEDIEAFTRCIDNLTHCG